MWKRSCSVLLASTPLFAASIAQAQGAPAAPAAPPKPAPAAAAPAPAPAAPPPAAPAPPPAAPPPAAPAAAPAAAAPAAPAAPEVKWYDKFKIGAFVDAYAAVNYNTPKPQTTANLYHAYDVSDGFAINWAGLNLSYGPDPVGATLELRFGPGANVHNPLEPTGLQNVKQALATWKPGGAKGSFTLDIGKFDSLYGSEVADTQGNMNYSRSLLFWLAQPLFFTGIRADYAVNDQWDLKLFMANGWNNSVALNQGKTGGVYISYKPSDKLLASVGYVFGPQAADVVPPAGANAAVNNCTVVANVVTCPPVLRAGADNGAADGHFRHLVDVVVDFNPTDKLRLLLNADVGSEDLGAPGSATWAGGNLGIRYAAGSGIAASLRGGVLKDFKGYLAHFFTLPAPTVDTTLVDGTVTLEYAPVSNLVFKLEQRFDYVDAGGAGLFQVNTNLGVSHTQSMTLLGVVASTN